MEFSSIIFLFIFFPLFLATYFAFKNRYTRNIILLIFSLLFYAWGEYIYILLMLFSIVINYYLAIKIEESKQPKKVLIISIIINLLLLGIFKYTDLVISIINTLLSLDIKYLRIPLPIGISFYTFQILSYVVDVYRKKVKVQKNILNLACYVTAFPQLIAGPIVRYETIEKELIERNETEENMAIGIRRFIKGLAKKVLIANNVGFVATQILSQSSSDYGFVGAWIGMIAYTLQIYFDFSGYSDMAIGIGRMLGFNFLENFNFPYIATSITDFWRRWHISLSSFFKDYVYIPLGGNRKHFIRNVLIVWGLTGIWHGANINFLMWGLYYGVFLLIEKIILKEKLDRLPKILKHIYTLIIIIFGWALFRSTTFNEIESLFKSLIGLNGIGSMKIFAFTTVLQLQYIIFFIAGIIFSTPIIKIKNQTVKDILLMILFIFSIFEIVTGTYSPFIYFRF